MAKAEEMREACRTGAVERIRALLAEDPDLAATRNEQGVSLLLQARYERKEEVAAILLAAHPGLDAFEAAAFGRVERLAERLREDPERTRAFSADGFTALHLAAFFGQPACARVLLEHGADPAAVARNPMRVTPLHSAAAARQVEIARMLLEAGAPVDARQQGGWTALQAAAQHGDTALVDLLLAHGADPRLVADNGKDAIALARDGGHAALADKLAAAR